MGKTQFYSATHRQFPKIPPGASLSYRNTAPSGDAYGPIILDPRVTPGRFAGTWGACGWWNQGAIAISAQTSNIGDVFGTGKAVAGTYLTIAGTGVQTVLLPGNYTSSASDFWMNEYGSYPTVWGSDDSVTTYDPNALLGQNVNIVSAGNDSGGTFTVTGVDIYGVALVEIITGANIGTAAGKKSFAVVQSILPGGTLSGASVQAEIGGGYGLPLLLDQTSQGQSFYTTMIFLSDGTITTINNSLTGSFTGANGSQIPSPTSHDVRGLFTPSGGKTVWAISQPVDVQQITSYGSVVGMIGAPQYPGG